MELHLIKENKDGSADYIFNLTEQEKDDLIRHALMSAIQHVVDKGSLNDPGELGVGNTTSGGKGSIHGSGEQSSESEQPGNGFKTSQVLG